MTEEDAAVEAEEERPSKSQLERVSSMFVMTPEMAKKCKEHGDKIMAERKSKAALYKLQRDEKLKAIGQENCDQFFIEKIAEVKDISNKDDEEALKTSEDTATELVTREVRKRKKAEAEALQKVLELAKEIEVPASVLLKDAAAEVAEQALKSTAELQMEVTAEAENLLLAPRSETMSGISST